jgi:hypothetical protein
MKIFSVALKISTKNNSAKTKVFVLPGRLQEQRPQLRKPVLGSSPGEDNLFSSEIRHDRITGVRTKMFISAEGLEENGHNHGNVSWF